jgi:hypothetical protein
MVTDHILNCSSSRSRAGGPATAARTAQNERSGLSNNAHNLRWPDAMDRQRADDTPEPVVPIHLPAAAAAAAEGAVCSPYDWQRTQGTSLHYCTATTHPAAFLIVPLLHVPRAVHQLRARQWHPGAPARALQALPLCLLPLTRQRQRPLRHGWRPAGRCPPAPHAQLPRQPPQQRRPGWALRRP